MAMKDQIFEGLFVSDNLRVALNTVGETEWQKFFESLRQAKYRQMENCDRDDLPDIRAQAKHVTELENIFKGIKMQAKISPH